MVGMGRTFLVTLVLLLSAATVVACGGDDDGGESAAAEQTGAAETIAEEGPTIEEDTAAIEQVLLAYGAAEGSRSCDYLAAEEIEDFGGLGACRRATADLDGVVFTVHTVNVDGDSATATISTPADDISGRSRYELVREDGNWRILSYPGEETGTPSSEPPAAEPEPQPEPSPEESDEAYVKRLFRDYARLKGNTICAIFSERFVDRELGGITECLRTFADKKPGVVNLQNLEFTGSNRALVIAKVNAEVLYFAVTRTGSKDLPYGGWEIDDFGDPGSG